MKNDLLIQVLESRKAKCLLPLIEMIGDLDGLVENGFKKFSDDIPKKIKTFQNELNDIDHILEDTYDILDDSELIKYSKRRGSIRRERRFKKNEGVFLSRDGVEDLLLNFAKLLSAASKSVTEAESQVYLTRVLDAPECSNKVMSAHQNKDKPLLKNSQLHSAYSKAYTQASTLAVVEPQQVQIPEDLTHAFVETEVKPKREYTLDDILNSPKDSMVVREGISAYRNLIALDTTFSESNLLSDWKELFAKANVSFKKDILLDAYIEYYSNPDNLMEKCVADFAVWNYLLPKLLLKTEFYSK